MSTMQVAAPRTEASSRPVRRHLVQDPRSGEVLTVPPGTHLEVRFRPALVSRWRVEARPGHLVPLEEGDHAFVFLVFDGGCPEPLRMVRQRGDRPGARDVRDLTVLVGSAG